MPTQHRELYRGTLAAFATGTGEQFVVACWDESPIGAWSTVLVAECDGTRTLFAPSQEAADDIARLHDIDRTVLAKVTVTHRDQDAWNVFVQPSSGTAPTTLSIGVAGPTMRGAIAALFPRVLIETRTYALFTEAVLRLLSVVAPGFRHVHAVGRLRDGHRDYHCARSEHSIRSVSGAHAGQPIGPLTGLTRCRFGFSDPPPRPAVGAMTALRFAPRVPTPHGTMHP